MLTYNGGTLAYTTSCIAVPGDSLKTNLLERWENNFHVRKEEVLVDSKCIIMQLTCIDAKSASALEMKWQCADTIGLFWGL